METDGLHSFNDAFYLMNAHRGRFTTQNKDTPPRYTEREIDSRASQTLATLVAKFTRQLQSLRPALWAKLLSGRDAGAG